MTAQRLRPSVFTGLAELAAAIRPQSSLEAKRAELEKAKRANQEANRRYSLAPYGTAEQDEIWSECVATAKLCDRLEDEIFDLENV
jgi:hypothetical protein